MILVAQAASQMARTAAGPMPVAQLNLRLTSLNFKLNGESLALALWLAAPAGDSDGGP